ncbi:MAG: SDR family oxidoreductase [Cytophagales bacterium]|nr:SDR family oxidoreductase [Cytophagales bacterium]
MTKLNGKVAVVTGGNSGIGYASAKDLLDNGAQVVITGRNPEAVNRAARELGAEGIVADQSSLSDTDHLVEQVKAKFGKIDILFINAGVVAMAPIEVLTEEQFDDSMNINFKGAFFTLQKFIPILSERASVINLSSINAYSGMPNTAAYAASKAALNSLTRTAAYELAPKKIRVNAVCPGPVKTPIFGKAGLDESAINEFSSAMQNRVPMKRFGESGDIAKLVTFLASDDSSFITGSEYVIDGGVILNPILG